MFDPFPFNEFWDKLNYYDGICSEWSKMNFVNPPFSNTYLIVLKALVEFYNGKSCILLIPMSSRCNDNFKLFCSPLLTFLKS